MKKPLSSKAVAWFFLVLLPLAILAVSFPGYGEEVVARVNNERITRQQLSNRARIEHLFLTLRGAPLFAEFLVETDKGQAALDHYRDYVLDKLITETIIMQKSEEMNIKVSDKEIEKRLNEIIKQTEDVKNLDELKQHLEQDRQDIPQLKQEIRRNIAREKVRTTVVSDTKVEEEEIKDYYEKNKETFRDSNDQVKPLKEVRNIIKDRLREIKEGEAWNSWLSRAKDEATIVKNFNS